MFVCTYLFRLNGVVIDEINLRIEHMQRHGKLRSQDRLFASFAERVAQTEMKARTQPLPGCDAIIKTALVDVCRCECAEPCLTLARVL